MLAAGLTFLAFLTCSSRFDDPDLWWHLKIGQIIWNTHQIPRTDLFSFTALGHSWVDHEWLSQLVLYLVYHVGGYPALVLWLCVIASTIVVLTYVLCGCWSGNWKVSLLGAIAALFFLTVSLAIRPLLIGHLFLVVELLLLYYGIVRRGRSIWALPVLFVVWANCHGSFLLGLFILMFAVAGSCLKFAARRLRPGCDRAIAIRLGVVLGLSLLAPLINPVGLSLVTYPVNVAWAQPEGTGNVEEWKALDIHDPRAIGLAAVLALVVIVSIVRRRSISAGEWSVLAPAAAMALLHARMTPVFGFAAAPVVCRLLAASWENYDRRRDRPAVNLFLIAAAGFMSLAVLPDTAAIQRQIATGEPVAAVTEIQASQLGGPLLNDYAWGGYLIWSNPAQPVFIDGRSDVFEETGVFRAYGRWAMLQEDPEKLLDQYGIRTCLIRSSAPMAHVLPYLPGWKRVYADKLAEVFTRNDSYKSVVQR